MAGECKESSDGDTNVVLRNVHYLRVGNPAKYLNNHTFRIPCSSYGKKKLSNKDKKQTNEQCVSNIISWDKIPRRKFDFFSCY
mmetsp:Transcript_26110/g.38687  ORF Transcript_26110/g.38687 Transcript_26110/m.38687 type:complete len:83 (+) Transcript_26110:2105-2353(+)